ncbi:MAG: polysaccharide deacetylase family protein [Thiotrichaceae bacterium]
MNKPVHIVLHCADPLLTKVRYVFDTLFMAMGIPVLYSSRPPSTGIWILYSPVKDAADPLDQCIALAHCPESWRFFEGHADIEAVANIDGLTTVFAENAPGFELSTDIPFDIVANAFYFLCSWSERLEQNKGQTRNMYSNSIFSRFDVPQDIVDQYLDKLKNLLHTLCDRLKMEKWNSPEWPQGATYALVLSHDVDFIPAGPLDIAVQGAKTIMRHLIRQRDPVDALRSAVGLALALIRKRDPYGCVPEMIAREKELGAYASFQVAVGHRHPDDVNYRIEDDRVRDYLRAIPDAGFDLCLHGSYRSTENPSWYVEEAALLAQRLGKKPLGSRQHFLSFDYDNLFTAQEQAGIQYDMSMGFPDQTGPRAGFSYPYYPYCLKEDRPYNVLQFSLFIMDVTLRSYLELKGVRAWEAIKALLDDLQRKQGCVSVVWHPIVFGGARDPGYDHLFWEIVDYTRKTGGLATDGRTINEFWRNYAKQYSSFNDL